jgi:hypothetical protein
LHEAIHATADTIGFQWTESTVEQAEQVFFAILRDNPGFVRWLIARDDPINREKGGQSESRPEPPAVCGELKAD